MTLLIVPEVTAKRHFATQARCTLRSQRAWLPKRYRRMTRLHLPFASPEGEGLCPRKWTISIRGGDMRNHVGTFALLLPLALAGAGSALAAEAGAVPDAPATCSEATLRGMY